MKIKKLRPDMKMSFIIITLSALITAGLMFYIAPGSVFAFLKMACAKPLLLLLNLVPVLFSMLMLYFITGNCSFSSGLPAMVFLCLAYGNRSKIALRQAPVVPSDMAVLTEVKSVVTNNDDFYITLAVIVIIVFISMCLFSFIFVRKGSDLTIKKRLIGIAVCLLSFSTMFNTVYSNTDLYDSFDVDGNIYFKVNQYISKGFLYSFIYDINNLKVNKPDGYTEDEFEQLSESADAEEYSDVAKPNIVMVMSEAFSDISNSEHISFDGYDNPLEFYNRFITRDDVLSGHIVVANFGGGTSDTEFDVLTGCSTRYIDSSQVSYNFVTHPMQTLPGMLKNIGYDTLAIHPGYGWFYNRINVFENMYFDDFKYLETDFDAKTQNKGGYISDKITADSIIDNFEEHTKNSDNPLFEFCITIQNHGPYEEKYTDLATNFSTDLELTDKEKAIYSGYFEGIDDADAQIEELVTYFEASPEPVVLVFFGDHLPGFSNGTDYFSKFRQDIDLNGSINQLVKAYETPYFIWANDAALKSTNIAENAKSLGLSDGNVISSFYLGAMLAEMLDMGNISPFFEYINSMRRYIPVASENWYIYSDGTLSETLNSEFINTIAKYKRWIYYKLFDEEVNY